MGHVDSLRLPLMGLLVGMLAFGCIDRSMLVNDEGGRAEKGNLVVKVMKFRGGDGLDTSLVFNCSVKNTAAHTVTLLKRRFDLELSHDSKGTVTVASRFMVTHRDSTRDDYVSLTPGEDRALDLAFFGKESPAVIFEYANGDKSQKILAGKYSVVLKYQPIAKDDYYRQDGKWIRVEHFEKAGAASRAFEFLVDAPAKGVAK